MAKPKPVAKVTICSICDLPWEDHTKGRKMEPTADVCIRLLKAELARRPKFTFAPQSFGSGNVNVTSLRATG